MSTVIPELSVNSRPRRSRWSIGTRVAGLPLAPPRRGLPAP